MSPVTERTVKADTTSLSQQVRFVHFTQQEYRYRQPVLPQVWYAAFSAWLQPLRVIRFRIVILVTGGGLKARAEQKHTKAACITDFTSASVGRKLTCKKWKRNTHFKCLPSSCHLQLPVSTSKMLTADQNTSRNCLTSTDPLTQHPQ